jgi:hypothetical protein
VSQTRFLARLVQDREALLDLVETVANEDLRLATRNPGWTIRHVLSHVLAADMDLISVLEAAPKAGTSACIPRMRSHEQHELEMEQWASHNIESLHEQLSQRAELWKGLLANLPNGSLDTPVHVGEIVGTVGDCIAAWEGHDEVHAEDIRLALLVE